jgi:hypothetical protein
LNNIITTLRWGIEILKYIVVCWLLDILGGSLKWSAGRGHTEYNCILCYILIVLCWQVWRDCCGYEQSLPWCWTEEASPWISQQLRLLVFHIAGIVLCIALCWCWQCLLTVGWNLLPHIVTTLDVTTVAWCCRQTQYVLLHAECPPAALQTTQWQWIAHVFTTWHCTGSSYSLCAEDWCLQRNLILWFGCWTDITDKCVSWCCSSYYRS